MRGVIDSTVITGLSTAFESLLGWLLTEMMLALSNIFFKSGLFGLRSVTSGTRFDVRM